MTDRPTNAELLAEAGRALYGDAWQSDMARLLGVSLRRVQYYAANERQPPDSMLGEIVDHLQGRADQCRAVAAKISDARA